MSDISIDVYREILRRVPVDSLCQFRLVCRSWRDIIDDPQFIKLHTHHGTGNDWIILSHDFKGTSNVFLLPLKHLICSKSDEWVYTTNIRASPVTPGVARLRDGFSYPTCNGLILITTDRKNFDWMIWNPFTGQSLKLPLCDELKGFNCKKCPRGFGYVEATDDYKVVTIVGSHTYIYSVNCGAWRRVQDFPEFSQMNSFKGAFVNGVLHWIVIDYSAVQNSGSDYWIFALNLNKEVYRKITLPLDPDVTISHFRCLEELGGCLFLFCHSWMGHFVLWMVDDYNGSDDGMWIKIMSTRIQCSYPPCITPVAYLKSEKKLLLSYPDRTLAWYDLETQCLLKVSMEVNPNEHDHLGCNHYADDPKFVLNRWSFQVIPASLVRLKSEETSLKRKRKRDVKRFGLKVSVDGPPVPGMTYFAIKPL